MVSGDPMNLAFMTISELQKAVCGWGGAQLQALLEAISDSNKRMSEARNAKGAIVLSAERDKVLGGSQAN